MIFNVFTNFKKGGIKIKKFIIATALGISLIGLSTIPASAATLFQTTSNTSYLPGSDNWNRGIKAPGNSYYLAYSYYYNPSYTHQSAAYLGGALRYSSLTGPGSTACANSDSCPSYSDERVSAGTQNGSWRIVRDTGSGDYLSSAW